MQSRLLDGEPISGETPNAMLMYKLENVFVAQTTPVTVWRTVRL
jgi:hypothetical protein